MATRGDVLRALWQIVDPNVHAEHKSVIEKTSDETKKANRKKNYEEVFDYTAGLYDQIKAMSSEMEVDDTRFAGLIDVINKLNIALREWKEGREGAGNRVKLAYTAFKEAAQGALAPQVMVTQASTANLAVNPNVVPSQLGGISISPRSTRSDSASSSSSQGSFSSRAQSFDNRRTKEKIVTSNAIKVVQILADIIVNNSESDEGVLRRSGAATAVQDNINDINRNTKEAGSMFTSAKSVLLTTENESKLATELAVKPAGGLRDIHAVVGTLKLLFSGRDDSLGLAYNKKLNNLDIVKKFAEEKDRTGADKKKLAMDAFKDIAATLPASHLAIVKILLKMMNDSVSTQQGSDKIKNKLTYDAMAIAAFNMLSVIMQVTMDKDPQKNDDPGQTMALTEMCATWISNAKECGKILDAEIQAKHNNIPPDYSDNLYSSENELKLSKGGKVDVDITGPTNVMKTAGIGSVQTISLEEAQRLEAAKKTSPRATTPTRSGSPTGTTGSGFYPSGSSSHGGVETRQRTPSNSALPKDSAELELVNAAREYLKDTESFLQSNKELTAMISPLFKSQFNLDANKVPQHINNLISQIGSSLKDMEETNTVSDKTKKLITDLMKVNNMGSAYDNYKELSSRPRQKNK